MSEPEQTAAATFRPSQSLAEMEADGMPEAAAMRAEEEASHLAAVEALAAVHPSPRTSGPKSDSVEAWAKRKRVEPWLFKAAKAGARWQCGEQYDPCLVTEAEFDAAIAFAANPYDTHNPKG